MTPIHWFWTIAAFCFGAVFGSFLNVCIYRMPLGKSILWPPSHCPKCYQPVGVWNIPIVGYFIVGGKCKQCGEPFSIRYALVELLTALMLSTFYFVFVVARGAPVPVYLAYSLLGMLVIVATFIDLDWKIIPQGLTVFGCVAAGVISTVYPWLHGAYIGHHPSGSGVLDTLSEWVAKVPPLDGLMASLSGMVAGAVLIVVVRWVGTKVFRREAMGLGDAKLLAVIGGFLGWKAVPLVFLAASVIGSVVGILSYLRTRDREVPLGPFLAMGALVVMLWGNELVRLWFVTLMHLESSPLILTYGQ